METPAGGIPPPSLQDTVRIANKRRRCVDHESISAAISEGNDLVLKRLLAHASEAEINAAVDEDEMTPLHLAAMTGRRDVVATLVRLKAHPSRTIPQSRETPIHLASQYGFPDVVRALVGVAMRAMAGGLAA